MYFTQGYGRAEEATSGGPWWLLEGFDGQWQLPMVLRNTKGVIDAASPYGYSGIYAEGLSQADAATAWEAARAVLMDMEVVSLFVRQSPLVSQAPVAEDARPIVRSHLTRCVEIGAPEAMWTAMEGRCRTSIRKAAKSGLTSALRPAEMSDLTSQSPFRRLYEGTMRRREARDLYSFPDEYYVQLLDGLRNKLLLGEVRSEGGDVVACSLFMRHGPFLHYHLSGSTAEAGRSGATNLLIWEACKYAAEVGLRRFHLGGGVANGDSLYKFKRSFGGDDLAYSAFGIVVNPSAYASATEQRAQALGRSMDELEQSPSFPAYRVES